MKLVFVLSISQGTIFISKLIQNNYIKNIIEKACGTAFDVRLRKLLSDLHLKKSIANATLCLIHAQTQLGVWKNQSVCTVKMLALSFNMYTQKKDHYARFSK